MHVSPDSCPVLVLNADFRPLSYYPLSIWSWQDAVKAVFMDRVSIVSEYETEIHSPSQSFRLPSVICLKDYVIAKRQPAFTRFNLFLRDKFHCQYCGAKFHTSDLTFDHVIPKSKGGKTCWTNIVTACSVCNHLKGNRLLPIPGLKLRSKPTAPSQHQLQECGRAFPPNFLHESWRDYLYWDSELEE